MPQLPIPEHFDPACVEEVWRVPYQERAEEAERWAQTHAIPAASTDEQRVCLMLVDCQNTFCIPDFELFVGGGSSRGAVEDNVRLCEFIYRNLGLITDISPTMDTHTAMQIFHPIFWVNRAGDHPIGGETIITPQEVESGVWQVNPHVAQSLGKFDENELGRYALHYVHKLSDGGKYPLMVWPYHAMLGGIGHALVSAIEEALFFHCVARSHQTGFETKGSNPLTENYSVLRPEVLTDHTERLIDKKNHRFIQKLLDFDRVIIAGQAKSHCVAWTIDDLLTEIIDQDVSLVRKVYLLEDCTSPVVIPGIIDFTDQADEAFARFADAGMHVVRSIEPVQSWPDFTGRD